MPIEDTSSKVSCVYLKVDRLTVRSCCNSAAAALSACVSDVVAADSSVSLDCRAAVSDSVADKACMHVFMHGFMVSCVVLLVIGNFCVPLSGRY